MMQRQGLTSSSAAQHPVKAFPRCSCRCSVSRGTNVAEQASSSALNRRNALALGSALVMGLLQGGDANAAATADMQSFEPMVGIQGKDYGKPRAKYPDFTLTPTGLQYKDLREGTGNQPKAGQTCIIDWDGYTIGYYGRPIQAKNRTKGSSFEGETEYYRFQLGAGQVIPAVEEAVASMKIGGIRRLIIPAELGWEREGQWRELGPSPSTFSGQRALDFVLGNTGMIDKTLLIDVELKNLKYDESLDAVVMAVGQHKILSKQGVIQPYFPLCRVKVQVSLVLFSPQEGDVLTGKVIQVGQDFIGLLVLGVINASVAKSEMRSEWAWNGEAHEWRSSKHSTHVVSKGSHVRFTVGSVQKLEAYFSIAGRLKSKSTGAVDYFAGKRGGKSKADKTQAHDKGAEELLNGKTKHKDKTKDKHKDKHKNRSKRKDKDGQKDQPKANLPQPPPAAAQAPAEPHKKKKVKLDMPSGVGGGERQLEAKAQAPAEVPREKKARHEAQGGAEGGEPVQPDALSAEEPHKKKKAKHEAQGGEPVQPVQPPVSAQQPEGKKSKEKGGSKKRKAAELEVQEQPEQEQSPKKKKSKKQAL